MWLWVIICVCVCMCDSIYANVSDNIFFLVLCSMFVCCSALLKMVRPTDRSGKRKATSPPTLPPPELDVALRQHRRAEVQGQGRCEASAHFQKQGVEEAWLTFGEAKQGNSREHLRRGGGRGVWAQPRDEWSLAVMEVCVGVASRLNSLLLPWELCIS